MTTLPPVSTIPSLSALERASILDTLFEPCTQLHTLSVSVLHEHTFSAYDDLITHIASQLDGLLRSDLKSDRDWLDAILAAHPRLGEKKVDSALSRDEQAGLQDRSGSGGEDEAEALRTLNSEYEALFEGLKFVTFVNGRSRPAIMEEMRSKIKEGSANMRTPTDERREAIQALAQIARDRANKLAPTASSS